MLFKTRILNIILNINIRRMNVIEYLFIAYYLNIRIRVEIRVIKYKYEIQRI